MLQHLATLAHLKPCFGGMANDWSLISKSSLFNLWRITKPLISSSLAHRGIVE